ncbi:hypothetical protein H9Q72_012810 [Fusarium xylarioides]|uniref:T6SS Phospholipase effector Tle1-like catalytic domain-containing protein n=1 Tax=Fusarium xylarioides TaxID=221167 RepID=A0A9P7L059_9HYPO|nr:hypothetical protein H9Q72_012810 [Fusarium xylarioides]
MNSGLPVRLIICVDGTWCSPDGPHGKRNQNVTNIYRFHASIKKGVCNDGFYQEKEYFSGIAAEDGIGYGERLFAGMLGTPCIEQISNVYEYICKSTGPEDEVWLYGFSRGAYVVRAVAGLLHYLRAIRSAGEACFKKDFDLALKVYKKMQQEHRLDEAAVRNVPGETDDMELNSPDAPYVRGENKTSSDHTVCGSFRYREGSSG